MNTANGHFYEAVTVSGGIDWFVARDAAESRTFGGIQGHLVTITSAQEDNFVIANFPEAFEPQPAVNDCAGGPTTEPSNCGDPYWLGGFQPTGSPPNDPAGGWEWVTGEPFVYAPWAAGEPNDFSGRDEDCLHPHPNLTPGWNDSQCDDRRVGGYVVEYDVAFADFTIDVEIEDDEFEVEGTFTLGAASDGIDPVSEDVTIMVDSVSITIPGGIFEPDDDASFEFEGTIDGVELEVEITGVGDATFEFEIEAEGANLNGTVNPVEVALSIGDDGGTVSVIAELEDDNDDD